MRPNGKPVPRGVHVGPGIRLMKPLGEFLPDGELLELNAYFSERLRAELRLLWLVQVQSRAQRR